MENEYRVRTVARYLVTHFTSDEASVGSETIGEYPNQEQAERVAQMFVAGDAGATFQTIQTGPEPCGTYYAFSTAQNEALMAFIHSDAYPAA